MARSAPALVLWLALASVPTSVAQTPADSVAAPVVAVTEAASEAADAVVRLRVRPVFSPGALYSSSRGFGVGGGVAVSNLALRDDHLQIEGRLAQRVQSVFGYYLTAEPEEAALFGLVGGAALTTSRFPFFGTGPRADPDGRLFLERDEWEAEGRIGWAPTGPRRLLLQPFARFRADRLRGYTEADSGAISAVSADDLTGLDGLVADGWRRGVAVGLSALTDTRDNEARPSRGAYAQGSARRFLAVDGSGLRFNRFDLLAYLFRPAPVRLPFQSARGAVFARVSGAVVREAGAEDLPVVYLPVLDQDLLAGWPARTFVGRDVLSVGLGMRGPIVDRVGAFRVDGIALALVGAAYDNVFREFTPRVRMNDVPAGAGENVPLRPSVGVGVNLHYRDRERPLVGGLVGIGPGGVTVTTFRLVVGLDRYRPEVR